VLLGSAGGYSVVEALPETGRTHQIRVHAAELGFPVVCDGLYGSGDPLMLSAIKRNWRGDPFDEKPLLARLALHAASLSLPRALLSDKTPTHASDGDALALRAGLPRDMTALLKQMEKNCPGGAFFQFLPR